MYQDQMTSVTTDTLLLACSLDVSPGSVVIELGCGSGGAMLASSTLNTDCRWIGIDVQIELLRMMTGSIEIRRKQLDLAGICCSVEAVPRTLTGAIADAVIMNPPFGRNTSGRSSPVRTRRISRSGSDLLLYYFIRASAHLLISGGVLIMINRPALLPKMILGCQSAGIAPEILQPVGSEGKPAGHIILHGRKDSSAVLKILPQIESEQLIRKITQSQST
jgi:tRNA1(Val) A37 N6-methylase TrmN6